jgi:hypothetical protein
VVDFSWNWHLITGPFEYRTNLSMRSKWLPFENCLGIQMVKARWQLKLLQPFENWSCIQMIYSLEPGI